MTLVETEFEKLKKIKMTRENLYQNIKVQTSDKNQLDALSLVRHWIDDDKFYQDKILNKGFLLVKYEKPSLITNQKIQVDKSIPHIYSSSTNENYSTETVEDFDC